ncbi:MAG: hypothetical protein AB1752_08145 [Candidatus Zixiibacteriota bacterium]
MKGPNEEKEPVMSEGTIESSETTTDQGLASPPAPGVKRKTFKGKGDSLNSMAERDRQRHDPANGSLASRIANLRKL